MAAAAEMGTGTCWGGGASPQVGVWTPGCVGCWAPSAHCSKSKRPVGRKVPNWGRMGSDKVRRIASPGRSMDRVDDESLEGTDM